MYRTRMFTMIVICLCVVPMVSPYFYLVLISFNIYLKDNKNILKTTQRSIHVIVPPIRTADGEDNQFIKKTAH